MTNRNCSFLRVLLALAPVSVSAAAGPYAPLAASPVVSSSPIRGHARRESVSAMMPLTTSGHPPEPVQGTAITPYQAYGAYPRPTSPRSPA